MTSFASSTPASGAAATGHLGRVCPGCGSARAGAGRPIGSSPPAESMSLEELRDTWAGFFHSQRPFFTYRRCGECSLLFCPTYLSEAELSSLYGTMNDNTFGVPLRLLERTQDQYFRTLSRFSPLRGTYVELGPDIGMVTRRAVTGGRFERVLLCEPNQAVHVELRRNAGPGAVICGDFDEMKEVRRTKADVVVMVHVLDHLLEPLDVLRRIRGVAAPDATLLVVTHDESSPLARLLGSKWPPYALQHPQLFSPATLASMLQAAGFETVSSTKSLNHLPVGYLCRHLAHAAGWKAEKVPSGGPALPLPLGNIVTVARPSR